MKSLLFILAFLTSVQIISQEDEFKPFTEDTTTIIDEFSEFKEFSEDTIHVCSSKCAGCPYTQNNNESSIDLTWGSSLTITLIALILTIIAGFLVRYNKTRNFRALFLLIGLGFFGFYNGACPCMISSFQNVILFIRGVDLDWTSMLWFIGLIPLTYIFGRVWCGWVCHLGALQEFLFRPKAFVWLRTEKASYYLKIIRYILVGILVFQLLIMGEIFWCKIDPFMGIFNISLNYNYEIISGVLIAILLISSIFSFRPFCRTACPVGIALGWISAIPGATILGLKKSNCISCKNCNETCDINAIIRRRRVSYLDNKECNVCGNCIDSCYNCGINFVRKNKKHSVVVFFKKRT